MEKYCDLFSVLDSFFCSSNFLYPVGRIVSRRSFRISVFIAHHHRRHSPIYTNCTVWEIIFTIWPSHLSKIWCQYANKYHRRAKSFCLDFDKVYRAQRIGIRVLFWFAISHSCTLRCRSSFKFWLIDGQTDTIRHRNRSSPTKYKWTNFSCFCNVCCVGAVIIWIASLTSTCHFVASI